MVTVQSGAAMLLCFCVYGQFKPVFPQWRMSITFQVKYSFEREELIPLFLSALPALDRAEVPIAFVFLGRRSLCSLIGEGFQLISLFLSFGERAVTPLYLRTFFILSPSRGTCCFCVSGKEKPAFPLRKTGFTLQLKFVFWGRRQSPHFS